MCGIIGITSLQGNFREPIGKVVRRCLERLEYRGYDSVGIAVIRGSSIEVRKGKGKIAEVSVRLSFDEVDGLTAVGHTRWATHGKPSDENAHPHTDCTGGVAVVHNGIISNFLELKEELTRKGHVFRSETDTEVLAHLIEEYLRMGYKPFDAFKAALSKYVVPTHSLLLWLRTK
jgi:glutamine--fructose-6-phosphate transaminase (EC 2.6.1.16)